MRLREQLVAVGRSAAPLLRSEDEWVHRRVEAITFPFPDQLIYQRHISIDFSIPVGLRAIDDEKPAHRPLRFYVPLSIVRKWPPLNRLDLRGEDGRPIPFLTARQNQLLDAATLLQMAEETVADAGLALSNAEKLQVVAIAQGRGDAAEQAFTAVCPPKSADPVTGVAEALRKDKTFLGLAQALRHNTLLWLRTEGEEDDREIVKFGYELPWGRRSRRDILASFGLERLTADFDTPHAGSAGSYHLTLTFPPPLVAADSELVLYDAAHPVPLGQKIDETTIRHKATPAHAIDERYDAFRVQPEVRGSRAKFYVTGNRLGVNGRVFVVVEPQIAAFLASAVLAAALLAGILLVFGLNQEQVAQHTEAAVAVLLVAPALLAYVLRPAGHVLVSGLLAGVRGVAVIGGAWPIVGATLVVVLHSSSALHRWLDVLAVAEGVTAAALMLPLLVRGFRRSRNWLRARKAARQLASG
jgi:hypothetical protein